MAGFEVIMYGRFWVIAKASAATRCPAPGTPSAAVRHFRQTVLGDVEARLAGAAPVRARMEFLASTAQPELEGLAKDLGYPATSLVEIEGRFRAFVDHI